MLRRARETVYRPNMASDIKEMADMWILPGKEATESARTKPLQQHSDGAEPWQQIGLDFFEIAGKHYLIAVD